MTATPRGTRLLIRKLTKYRIWEKLLYERLGEPLHLNLASVFVAVFGGLKAKVKWDLVLRPYYAYGVLHAAEQALQHRLNRVTVVELGVANGEGLLNLCRLARRAEQCTGVRIAVAGFDLGSGMPAPVDYRDHPELYMQGDFPMDRETLMRVLPPRCVLKLGPLNQTIPEFLKETHPPIGFAAIDVDYYSSAKDSLTLFAHPDPERYVPVPVLYFDDVMFETHNDWCGELLAIREFNAEQKRRKIARDRFLSTRRIFKNPRWLQQIYILQVLDHSWRSVAVARRNVAMLGNDYLRRADRTRVSS
jgi:hypothetical protein